MIEQEHAAEYKRLLKGCQRYLEQEEFEGCYVSLELPTFNMFWQLPEVQKFLESYSMRWKARVHACAMGIETSQGHKVGKSFTFAMNCDSIAQLLEKRFQCTCTETHSSLSKTDYNLTERYSLRFARFFIRTYLMRVIKRSD